MRSVGAILVVVAAIVLFWYAACLPMNIKGVLTEAERAGAIVVHIMHKRVGCA